MGKTITLGIRGYSGTPEAWADAMGKLTRGEVDAIKTGGAFEIERLDGWRAIGGGRLWGTEWHQAARLVEPTAAAYSYGTLVGVLVGGVWLVPAVFWSMTTSRHQGKLLSLGGVRVQTPEDLAAFALGTETGAAALALVADGFKPADAVKLSRALVGEEVAA